MFATQAVVNGNFGGAAAGDAACNADSNKPSSGTFKALMVEDSGARAASPAADWVLQANTTYGRADGTIIGTTDSSALFNLPLTNAIAPGKSYWTGILYGGWTASSG